MVGEGPGGDSMEAGGAGEEAGAALAAAWAEQMGERLREHLGRSPPAAAASPVPGALGALVACIFLGSLMAFLQLLLQNAVRGPAAPAPALPTPPISAPPPHYGAPLR